MTIISEQESAVFVEFRPNMRRLIADAIESLLLLLDEIDGDADREEEPDLEDGHDAERGYTGRWPLCAFDETLQASVSNSDADGDADSAEHSSNAERWPLQ